MRRRFQRTHNIELLESRKNTYHEEKSSYQTAMKRETKIVEGILQPDIKH